MPIIIKDSPNTLKKKFGDSETVTPSILGMQQQIDNLHAALSGELSGLLDPLTAELSAHLISTDPHPAIRASRYFFGQI